MPKADQPDVLHYDFLSMDASLIAEAKQKVDAWIRYHEGRADHPTVTALADLRLISRYARYLEQRLARSWWQRFKEWWL